MVIHRISIFTDQRISLQQCRKAEANDSICLMKSNKYFQTLYKLSTTEKGKNLRTVISRHQAYLKGTVVTIFLQRFFGELTTSKLVHGL